MGGTGLEARGDAATSGLAGSTGADRIPLRGISQRSAPVRHWFRQFAETVFFLPTVWTTAVS
ncbi:hypothetical protein EDF64_103114 [Curtobacterium flaccumfaciens]|uniref:Uncharacterized protein n=1 Tax=Curtobacterium flaccumfaciens TaxID=2035 RepID=A0A4R6DKE2_9MICO|nr:hypothetical protein EDF64_103114 [Curtobacterium flaccumfaciens]